MIPPIMNNTSSIPTNRKIRTLFSPVIMTFLTVLYALITWTGILNNFIAILVFCRERELRRPFNIFLLNIFVADMLYSLSTQPYIWIDFTKLDQQGKIAGLLCADFVGLAPQVACVTANALSLFAVTTLRYLSIVRNYQGLFVTSMTFVKLHCAFTWVAGILSTMPNVFSYEYDRKESICYRKWPNAINGAYLLYIISRSHI